MRRMIGRRKNKEKIASIDFNSTNFYIEVEVFTTNAIQNLHMDNRMIDFEKSPIENSLFSLITKVKKTSLFVLFLMLISPKSWWPLLSFWYHCL
jgi:hypothetical protein